MSTCVELGQPHCDCCWDEGFDCCECGEPNPSPVIPIEDYLDDDDDTIFDDDTTSFDDDTIDWGDDDGSDENDDE